MKVFERISSGFSAKTIVLMFLASIMFGCSSSDNDDGVINTEDPDDTTEVAGDPLDEIGDGAGAEAQTGEGAICDDASRNDGWEDNCEINDSETGFNNSLYAMGIQRTVFCLGINPSSSASIEAFADGVFGPMTKLAVEEFQERRNILVDGFVGPQTWGALEDVLDAPVVFDTEYAQYSVRGAPGVCDTEAQFYQRRTTPFDWKMARTPGSAEMILFSTDAPE